MTLQRLVFSSVCMLGMLLTARGGAAQTQTQTPAQAWFSETITLGEVNLPAGLQVSASASPDGRAYLSISNQTSTALFILSLTYKDTLVMVTPDPLWKERVGMAHEVASFLVKAQAARLLAVDALADLDPALKDNNVVSSSPPPAGTAIPAAQASELLLVYAGQVYEVPFTVTYRLNPRLENASPGLNQAQVSTQASPTAKMIQETAQPLAWVEQYPSLWVGLLFGALLGVSLWLVWRIKRRQH